MRKRALFFLNLMLFVCFVSLTIKTAHSRNISDDVRMENAKALTGSKSVMCSDVCKYKVGWYCIWCQDCCIHTNNQPQNPVKYCEAAPE